MSQNATATLGNITSCPGENVLVPIDVTGFYDVGAMTIYISYDTNAAEFLSLQNINLNIPGGISYYATGGVVNIAYSSTTPFYIDGEKLFDLSFAYLADSTDLLFNPGTEIATTLLEIIPLDTYGGSITNSIHLISQPENVQSYPDNDVVFGIVTSGTMNYQWQENSGSGWNDLQNNGIYSGVTTDTLVIADVTLDFNGNEYRCELTADECIVLSDPALLEVALAFPVATLGQISSCPENEILEPLTAGDFLDVIEFNFNIAYNTNNLTFLELLNIHEALQTGSFTITPLNNPPGITIHWTDENAVSISNGKLFDLRFNYSSQDQDLNFSAGTFVKNSQANFIDITLNDGMVEQFDIPGIISHPEDITVEEYEEAFFSVTASGADGYTWMMSTDGGNNWNDLTNTPPYYNVYSNTLIINPAIYDQNNYRFACRMNNENCITISNDAALTVDTLTATIERDQNAYLIYPNPVKNWVTVTVLPDHYYYSAEIYTMQGELIQSLALDHITGNKIQLNLSGLAESMYVIKITGNSSQGSFIQTKKMIKTN